LRCLHFVLLFQDFAIFFQFLAKENSQIYTESTQNNEKICFLGDENLPPKKKKKKKKKKKQTQKKKIIK